MTPRERRIKEEEAKSDVAYVVDRIMRQDLSQGEGQFSMMLILVAISIEVPTVAARVRRLLNVFDYRRDVTLTWEQVRELMLAPLKESST